jgi:aspartate/methionine/tyrosine aminotransferase
MPAPVRFSSRLNWSPHWNALAELREAKRAAGEPVLDLTESNPTAADLDYPAEAILAALSDLRALRYEPAALGLDSAREAVSRYYASLGAEVAVSHLVLTASTSEAYAFVFKLLCDAGDEVLWPQPSYPLFEYLAGLECVQARPYPLRYDGAWHIDFEALERAASPRTRAVILVNPNNPTGSFLDQHEYARLMALCRDRGLAIVSDEVFADFAFAPNPRRVTTLAAAPESAPLTFCLSGLSKIAGLPQMKLGWMAVSGAGADKAMARLELIADTYLSVGTPVQLATPRLLEVGALLRSQIRERTAGNLAWLRGAISGYPCELLHLEGGWYATLQVPASRSEEEWALALLGDHNVLVQPGYFYDFAREAFLIASLLTPPAEFHEGIHRLLEAVRSAS